MKWFCRVLSHRWMVPTSHVYHDGYTAHCKWCGETKRVYYNEATDDSNQPGDGK